MAAYFKELGEVGKSSNLDVINVFGAVLLEDREQVCAGVGGAQHSRQFVKRVGQHTANLPLCVCVCACACVRVTSSIYTHTKKINNSHDYIHGC